MTVFGSILLLLGIRFLDVAPEAGLDFRHHSGSPEKKYILETIGGGVAWIDYDRDGWPDLYLVNGASGTSCWPAGGAFPTPSIATTATAPSPASPPDPA